MIQVTQETRSDWCVVSVRGRADAEAAEELELALRSAIEQHNKVAANFSGVDYLSSAGIRALLQAARAAESRNREFTVCSLTSSVKKVFDLTGLQHVLRVQGELPC
jgi:anti-sigma B factor antagonist